MSDGRSEGRAPLYLARASYRRRRLIDALRLLPFLMFGLWLLPLLWGGEGTDRPVGAGARAFCMFSWSGLWAFWRRSGCRALCAGRKGLLRH